MEKQVLELFDDLNKEIGNYNQNSNKALIEKAFFFAYEAHKGVLRKSKDPYIVHPLKSALLLTKLEADDVSIIGAILHDVFDNVNISSKEIKDQFGDEVLFIVKGVHKLGQLYYTPDMNRKEVENLKKNLISVGNDLRIFLIKIADRLHNLQTLEYLPESKRYRIAKETEEVYLPIANFLSIGEFIPLLNELCFKYTEKEEYEKLQKIFGKKQKYYEQKIIDTHNHILKIFYQEDIQIEKIEGRVKSLHSIYKKVQSKNLHYNEIYDVLALRIILKKQSDTYKVLGVLHKIYTAKYERFKDYISNPKKNGYQSIHTTVYDEQGEFLEFQIQTKMMSILNKSGFAAHFMYKGFGLEYEYLPEWMKEVMDMGKKTIDGEKILEKLLGEITFSDIKVFDEKRQKIILPKDSTLIDYAFQYNIEYGKFFESARVNNQKILNPFYILQSGDEIILKKGNTIYTHYNIENFFLLKTKKAREEIKMLFKKYSQKKLEDLGRHILNTQLENLGMRHFEAHSLTIKRKVLAYVGLKKYEQMYLHIALDIFGTEKIINYLSQIAYSLQEKSKGVSLKVRCKTKEYLSIQNMIQVFHDFHITLLKIQYKRTKNTIVFAFVVDGDTTLKDLLKELKRLPNILEITRVFPIRLKIYYFIYSIGIFLILGMIFGVYILNISLQEKENILKIVLSLGGIMMIAIVFLLKYVVKTMLPDILRYKRFWLSLFLLNTFIFSVIFYEVIRWRIEGYFILYILSIFLVYLLIFYDIMGYMRKK